MSKLVREIKSRHARRVFMEGLGDALVSPANIVLPGKPLRGRRVDIRTSWEKVGGALSDAMQSAQPNCEPQGDEKNAGKNASSE